MWGGVNTSADTSVKKDDSTSNETSEDGSKTHGEAEEVKEDSVESEERKASDSELSKDGLSFDGRKRFSPAGAFEADITETKLHVNATYGDEVFPKDTRMVVKAITDETKLKEAGEKAVADAKETDDKDLTVTSVLGFDISFYAPNDEDKDEKVQPADGKDVTITLTMPEDKAEASEKEKGAKAETTSEDSADKAKVKKASDSEKSDEKSETKQTNSEGSEDTQEQEETETVVKLIHVEDEKTPVVLSDVEVNEDTITFTSNSFSPFYVVKMTAKEEENSAYSFKTYWRNETSKQLSYTNADFDKDEIETQQDLQYRPQSNNLINTTVQLSLSLKGDEKTHYPAGSIKIEVPESYYEGWDATDIHRVAVNDDLKRLDPLYWMIPKAPDTNTLSDFNYTVIKKTVHGQTETYYQLTNHKTLTGGTEFLTELAYRLRPTMLKVTDETKADGEHVGHYAKELPIYLNIDENLDGTGDYSESHELSVDVETKVNPTKITMAPSTVDVNQGIFFSWDDAWGKKPADADNYFYIVWYAELQRATGSTQPFDYVLSIDKSKTEGGQLIGVKKYTANKPEAYEQKTYILSQMDKTYSGIYGDTSAIDKTWPGITENPAKNQYYNVDYCTSRTENPVSYWHFQGYCLLYRYPMSKVEDAKKNDIDVENDGFKIKNGITITEHWSDGYTRTIEQYDGQANVKKIPSLGGGNGADKKRVDVGYGTVLLNGLQSIITQGNDAPLIRENSNWSFALESDSAATSYTWNPSDKTYTTNGSSAEITDRPLMMFTDVKNSVYGYGATKTPSFDLKDAKPMTLSDEDYRYTNFYIESAAEYDITYSDALGYQVDPRSNKKYSQYKPYIIETRKAGEDDFKPFGEVTINEKGQFYFYNYETKTSQYIASNKRVNFPENTVQIRAKHDSDFYEAKFRLVYSMELKATTSVVNRIKEDMESGERTYIGSFADMKWSSGGNLVREYPMGQYWYRVAYIMSPLKSDVVFNKQSFDLKNDPVNAEETKTVSIDFYNSCTSTPKFATTTYMKSYMVTSGIFYDLLPAGTYVKRDEIGLATRLPSPYIYNDQKITPDSVKMEENWEGSGQTMLIVAFTVPDDPVHMCWHGYWFGARLNYTLHNPYTNITDRGTNPVNTVAFVNTSDENVIFNTNVNKNNIDKTTFEKKEYYKDLINKSNDNGWEVALTQANITYNPVTVLEAAFTNRVSSDTNSLFEKDNTAYLGDNYTYRLQYTSASNTRTDNMVIYDVLDQDTDKTGDFSWVDISSIYAKQTYDPNNANTADTCKPVVYYATVTPTDDQKDVDTYKGTIWTTVKPKNASTIRAIAIDCRKTDKGANFVLNQSGTLAAYVHCKATDVKNFAERKNKNQAVLSARLFSGKTAGESASSRNIEAQATLHLIKPELTIKKSSDPVSGTADRPTEIGNTPNKSLTYTLEIVNETKKTYPGVLNVKIRDVLPEGLSLDSSRATTVSSKVLSLNNTNIGGSNIEMGKAGQELTFHLPQFAKGTVAITIPVIRKDTVTTITRYENTAEIVQAGNVIYDDRDQIDHKIIRSNTTYHISTAHTLTVKPNGGTWNGNEADTVMPLYNGEQRTIPDPIREGYTFTGWTVEGDERPNAGMSALSPAANNTFTMADTDTVLQANWTINTYLVTVTKTFRGIDALPNTFAIENNVDTTKFTTANATSGKGSEDDPYTWTISVPYHTDITFTETGYDASGYSVTTSAHTANATGSSTAMSGTITVPANDHASVSFDNVYSHTSYEVTKTWAGPEKYLKQSIPEKLTVELYKDGVKVADADQTLSADHDWTANWDTLPDKNPYGSKIQYSVKEVLDDQRFEQGAPVTSASESGTEASITNTLKTVNVTAVKTWKDQKNKFETRPESITIHLLQNGVPIDEDATISVNADGTWTHTFTNVPKCDAKGHDYIYTVTEDSVNGYNTNCNGMSIINTLKTMDVTVQVNWKDFDDQWKLRPESVHITLLKNGKSFDGNKVDLSSEDDWTHVFTDLPVEDAAGNAYRYTVTEDDVHAYDKKIDVTQNTLLTIENTLKTRDITATKNWVDDDDKKKTRPDSITLRLTQREKEASASELSPVSDEIWATASEISPASDGSWTTSFDHLPVEDKKGHSYSYDVSEDAVTGYTSSIAANSDHSHYTVTNTICTPVVSDPPIKKVIEGDTPSENAEFQFTLKALRQLTADGKEIPAAELPMPEGADGQVKTVTVQGAGEYEFGNIEFSMPGTYIYQMSEVDTKVERYTYDTSVYIVTYTVTQNDDHLDIVRTITKDGAEAETTLFTNTYKKPSGSSGDGSHVGPGPKPGNEPGPTGGPDDTTISTTTPDEGRVLGASRGPAPVQNGGRVLGAVRNARTGDASLMLVWFVLMLAALGLLAGYVMYIRKHRTNRK